MINVEVAYANAEQQAMIAVQLPAGASVKMAIEQSGALKKFPEIDLAVNKVGIFGKLVTLETILQIGDRVEIYRPLLIDPMIARKQRAELQKKKKV